MTKRCSKCSKIKECYNRQPICIECHKEKCRKYYQEHKEHIKQLSSEYQKEHRIERTKYNNKWQRGKSRAKYFRERRKNTQIKLRDNIRTRLRIALYNYHEFKKPHSALDCGCSFEFLFDYLERQFKQGMSWNNYGSVWSIDHIKPLSKFDLTNQEQFWLATHFTNLQPLFCSENSKKGDYYGGS